MIVWNYIYSEFLPTLLYVSSSNSVYKAAAAKTAAPKTAAPTLFLFAAPVAAAVALDALDVTDEATAPAPEVADAALEVPEEAPEEAPDAAPAAAEDVPDIIMVDDIATAELADEAAEDAREVADATALDEPPPEDEAARATLQISSVRV